MSDQAAKDQGAETLNLPDVDDLPDYRPVDIESAKADALAKGWVPLKEWVAAGKKPEDHVDPYTYLQRGRAIEGRNKALSEADELRARLAGLESSTADILRQQREVLMRQLQEQLDDATEQGDTKEVRRLAAEMADLKRAPESAAPQAVSAEREVQEWKRKHRDVILNPQQWAIIQAIDSDPSAFDIPQGLTPSQQLDEYLRVARLERPDVFGPPRAVTGPDSGGRPSKRQDSGKITLSSMTEGEKIEARRIAQRLGKTLEEYVKLLNSEVGK